MIDDQDDLDDGMDDGREGFDGPESTKTKAQRQQSPSPAAPRLNTLDLLAGLADAEIDTRDLPAPPPDSRLRVPARPLTPARATVPGLFARRSINLVIGSSTAGKTPLILTQMESYLTADDHSFLGYPLPADQEPDQCAAIVCSGTLDALHARINAMQLEALSDPVRFPVRDWEPVSGETTIETLSRLYDQLSVAARRPIRFLFIDGLQLMLEGTGKVNDPSAVRAFYRLLTQFCLNRDCTILGTIGQAKMRKGEYYPLLADRVYGSTMWAQEADTLIGIEQLDLHLQAHQRPKARRIEVQPKSHPTQMLHVDFDEIGRLILIDYMIRDKESPLYAALDTILEKAQPGATWTRDDLNIVADSIGASGRTLERWITSRCHESLGMLERRGGTKNRTYRKPSVN